MIFRNRLSLLAVCLICVNTVVFAQKTSEKPFHKWSRDEAMKILSSSPWSQTYQSIEGTSGAAGQQIGREQRQTASSGGGDPRSTARNFGPAPVVIRLHSAIPVRQAMNRMQQLSVNYDKMDDQKKAEFDAATKGALDCAICTNFYVVTITKFKDSTSQSVEEGIFQRTTLNELKGNVWLENDKGEKTELVHFTPPKMQGDPAIFFFARKDGKGNAFLTAQNKSFKFVFSNDFLGAGNPYAILVPANFEFKVSKILVGEKIEF
jgi:hypothetical protein